MSTGTRHQAASYIPQLPLTLALAEAVRYCRREMQEHIEPAPTNMVSGEAVTTEPAPASRGSDDAVTTDQDQQSERRYVRLAWFLVLTLFCTVIIAISSPSGTMPTLDVSIVSAEEEEVQVDVSHTTSTSVLTTFVNNVLNTVTVLIACLNRQRDEIDQLRVQISNLKTELEQNQAELERIQNMASWFAELGAVAVSSVFIMLARQISNASQKSIELSL